MRALVPLLLAGCATAAGDTRPATDEGPVVIELFTSQGCSSCPPADALVGRLARAGQLGGRALAPLTFHVDYWDELGWADPYASAAWTERQREYAHALGGDNIYTPELVVAGQAGMVGSQGTRVTQAIAAAPRQQRISAKATWAARDVAIEATAPAGADVYAALYEESTRTEVLRGENAGETLASAHVVRRLVLVARAGTTATQTIPVDPSWHEIGAIAFAQRPDRAIVGAALLPRSR